MYVHMQEAEQGVSKNASMSNKLYVITNYSIIVCNSKMSAIDLFICLFDRVSQKTFPNQLLKLMCSGCTLDLTSTNDKREYC